MISVDCGWVPRPKQKFNYTIFNNTIQEIVFFLGVPLTTIVSILIDYNKKV